MIKLIIRYKPYIPKSMSSKVFDYAYNAEIIDIILNYLKENGKLDIGSIYDLHYDPGESSKDVDNLYYLKIVKIKT
jgi:hypothetical protein